METEATYKICIFGEGGVGKTTFTRRYLTGIFDDATKMTIGAAIHVHYVTIEGIRVALQIWDFGGEDQFKFMLPVYAHGSSGAIFMFDVSRYVTLQKSHEWISSFNEGIGTYESNVPILMAGSKIDLADRVISAEEAMETTKELNIFE